MTLPRMWKWGGGGAAGLVLALAALPASPVAAQQRHRHNEENRQPSDDFPAKVALDAQSAKLETDLASMLERRAQVPSPTLDFQIDMAVLARWLTQQADNAPPRSPLQAATYLRAEEFLNCSSLLSPKLADAPISPAQADGLAKLHKMTFKLPDVNDIGKLDDFCKEAAIALVAASGPLPDGMHELPLMRPRPIDDHPAAAPGPAPAWPRTLAQLTDEANHASVSPPLHAQLVALANSATAATTDPANSDEATALSTMLQQVMDLVTGLQTNVGVDSDQRAKMETELTDGIALFADPRTRDAGDRRIQSLDQYRKNLARIRDLNLSPTLSTKFGPAFVYADENPDSGNEVLDAIAKWIVTTSGFDNHSPPPGMTSNQNRIIEAMHKQFTTERDGFVTDAGNLTPSANATISSSPSDLTGHLQKMDDAIKTAHLAERANLAMTALVAFHPRPTGGLERRVAISLGAIADNLSTAPGRLSQREQDRGDDGRRFLESLERLAQTAADVSTGTSGIPDSVGQAWAGGKLQDFDSKRSDLVTALASHAAAGKEIDTATLDRLDQAKALVAGLHDAAGVQTALDQVKPLTRWVDWTITPANLQTILQPARDATAAAVAGFIEDDDDALHQWPSIRDHYAPLMNLVASAGTYADQCTAMPGELVGEISKLATPMNNQPFGDERFASLCMGLWNAFLQAEVPDATSADAMVQTLLKVGK